MKEWRSKTPPLQWQLTLHQGLTIQVVIILTTSLIIEGKEEITMEEVKAEVHLLITSINFHHLNSHNLKDPILDQKGQSARFVVRQVILP